jgi:hypothetical protein
VVAAGTSYDDVQLLMNYDDGFVAYLDGKEIGRRNTPAIPNYTSAASAAHPKALATNAESIFNPALTWSMAEGTNVLAIQGMNRSTASDGDFLILPQLIARHVAVHADQLTYLASPTPGSANAGGMQGVVPTVSFGQAGGTYTDPFNLALAVPGAPPGTRIYYTLDRSAPTTVSLAYAGPISITNSVIVRARAFAPGYLPGVVASASYLKLATNRVTSGAVTNLQQFGSDLPIVVVHSLGAGAIAQAPDTLCTLEIHDPIRGRSTLTNAPDLSVRALFHLHGSSTLGNPKANFSVQVVDERGQNLAVPLAGMPPHPHWILYAPDQFEPVLIHNPFMYRMSREIGRYASRTRFVEVFLNTGGGALTPASYNGIYALEEKIALGPDRVDVNPLSPVDLNEPEITGGYMLKIDRLGPGEGGLPAANQLMVYVDPGEPTILTRPAQVNYIQSYFNNFYSALGGADYRDPVKGYAPYIDAGAWVDHFILNVFSLNVDGMRLSGYFYKPRSGPIVMGPIWDFDRTLGSTDGRDGNPRTWRSNVPDYGTDFFNYTWWDRLFTDPDFFQRFIDRYQDLRRSTLSTEHVHGVIDQLVGEIHNAVPRELVRWSGFNSPRSGTQVYDGYSYNFGTQGYAGEVAFLKQWLRDRFNFMDTNFVDPPSLSLPAGIVTPGTIVTLAGPPDGTIYYTTNGADPRLPGGDLNPQAQPYLAPVSIQGNARLVARTRNLSHRNLTGANNPPLSSPWSGVAASTYVVTPPPLVITEIMFHSGGTTNDGGFSHHDFDYLELKNAGTAALSLKGFRLPPQVTTVDGHSSTNGLYFDFPDVSVPAGGYVILAQNIAAFRQRYGQAPVVVGQLGGSFVNGGTLLDLVGPLGEPVMHFAYKDSWVPLADGYGFSLVIKDETTALDTWGAKSSWRASAAPLGSPGTTDPRPASPATVYINEVLGAGDGTHAAGIELINPGSKKADVGGWWLTDDSKDLFKAQLPSGTVISGGGYLVLSAAQLQSLSAGRLRLGPAGATLYLLSADSKGVLNGYLDSFKYGDGEPGLSYGRYQPNASFKDVDHPPLTSPSLGFPNSPPVVGPVVIREVMYQPAPSVLNGSWWEQTEHEYVQLFNTAAQPIDLGGTTPWSLQTSSSSRIAPFTFAPGTVIPSQGILLVVGFDPALEPWLLTEFRERYNLDAGVPIVGPFHAPLDNTEDDLRVFRGTPDGGWVYVDRVQYNPGTPWPTAAAGGGVSLHRLKSEAYGDDPANWVAAPPSPGNAGGGPSAPPVVLTAPADQVVNAGDTVTFTAAATGQGDLHYQWKGPGGPIGGATATNLVLAAVGLDQAGDYSVVVSDAAGAVESASAHLDVLDAARITAQPEPTITSFGGPATFHVRAVGTGPLAYQWSRNGAAIAGGTNEWFYLPSADFRDMGAYTVTVTDSLRSMTSAPAALTIGVKPTFLLQPQPTAVTQGSTLMLSFSAYGTPPLVYRWKRGTTFVGPSITSSVPLLQGVTLTLTNMQATNAGNYVVQISNPLSTALNSSNAAVVVLADADRDGIPDDWETANGLGAGDPSDAALDSDHDGMTNLQEYIAGTNPRDPASYFKIDRLTLGAGGAAMIAFTAQSNRTYSVQLSEGVADGTWFSFSNIPSRVIARTETVVDPFPSGGSRHYRLVTPAQPDTRVGPVILSRPRPATVGAGESAQLSVVASGLGRLGYQWQQDGVDIPGATGRTLAVPFSTGLDSQYRVKVTDALGTATSAAARVRAAP